MGKVSAVIRLVILAALVIIIAFMCGVRLLQTQIVDGNKYLEMTKDTYESNQDIDAARGQIADCKGNLLNTNKIIYNINFQRSSLAKGTENDIIYRVLTVLVKNGEKWNDSLPISKTQPYTFDEKRPAAIETLKSKLGVGSYATVDNCVFQLYKEFDISDKYDEQMRRYIAGVRYEMLIKDFSDENKFVLASDISGDTVLELKELMSLLNGVDITESWERSYEKGTVAPHLRGTVGAISADEYAELKNSGYNLNDIIGKDGVEQALEDVLRGTRGTRTITRGSDGAELKDEVTKEPVAGKSVQLTIDSDYQKLVQELLEYHVKYLSSPYYTTAYDATLRGKGCQGGACVVLDVKTGGVLACASYPGYDLNEYVNDYDKVISQKNSPVFNRALNGLYRPGSAFKTITATAGMAEGVIAPSSTIDCNHVYTYYSPSFEPTCLGYHGAITVREGLQYSCNVFFYETARRLGIETLAKWAGRFGVGQDLGFELGMSKGQMSSLELFQEKGYEWYEGNIVQAGIGQCETLMTPMHLAVQAMTLANNGVRYEPHIVKSVYNYDFSEKEYDKKPVVADDFSKETGMDSYMKAVRDGMKLVASTQVHFMIDGAGYVCPFDYLDIGKENVAIKTGTPQTSEDEYNSALVGIYPADNPKIAFGIILEHGEFAKVMAANVIKAYTTGTISTNYDEKGFPKTIL